MTRRWDVLLQSAMGLVVQKYGGSSLASPKHIRAAALRISNLKKTNCDVVVVVSAMGRTTDHLIRLAHKTVKEPAQRELDMLMTAGERVSMSLLAMALHDLGVPAISFTGSQSGIVTSSDHTDAKIIDVRATRIREQLSKGRVVIVAGFQGVSEEKEITTLGRGGSDTTAVAIAAALQGDYCEVLTDVDGIYTADPRLVPSARLIPFCSYDEALEMASLGAKMQSRSIEMARRYNVKVKVTGSQKDGNTFTEIGPERLIPNQAGANREADMEATEVRGVTTRDGYHFFKVKTDLAKLVSWMQSQKTTLRFFQASADCVSFLCEEEKAALLKKNIVALGELIEEEKDLAIVSVVGHGVGRCSDFLQKFLEVVVGTEAKCFLLSGNSFSVTAAVPRQLRGRVTEALHQRFLPA